MNIKKYLKSLAKVKKKYTIYIACKESDIPNSVSDDLLLKIGYTEISVKECIKRWSVKIGENVKLLKTYPVPFKDHIIHKELEKLNIKEEAGKKWSECFFTNIKQIEKIINKELKHIELLQKLKDR